ncbi:MAG: hypothetical protein RR909_04185 [Bacilli bacterium]
MEKVFLDSCALFLSTVFNGLKYFLSVKVIDKSDAMIGLVNGSVKQGDDWNWDASKYILILCGINLSVKDEVVAIDIPITLDPNDSNQFVKIILMKDSVNTISLQATQGKDID